MADQWHKTSMRAVTRLTEGVPFRSRWFWVDGHRATLQAPSGGRWHLKVGGDGWRLKKAKDDR